MKHTTQDNGSNIMTKRITIAGAGALGSHLALFIRNEADIRIIDDDRVERKNVLAQFHGNSSVGKNKAQAVQASMKFLFGIELEAIPHRITSDNVETLLTGTDLVIDCLDNAVSRQLIQDCVRRNGIPCVHGALAADGAFGQVIWDENFKIDVESNDGQATCEGGEHLPFIGIVSSCLARVVQEFINNDNRMGFQIHPGGVIRT